MDISIYFKPIDLSEIYINNTNHGKKIADLISCYSEIDNFPDLTSVEIVIIGVLEDRNAVNNKACAEAPNIIRKHLYNLFAGDFSIKIADLGNIHQGHTIDDTYFAVSSTIAELLRNNILPIIIGGSQDLTFANYMAYENIARIINIVDIDPLFDLGRSIKDFDSRSYLSKIILHKPNYLFNFSNIGYQSYFVDKKAVELMNNLFFDIYRLGKVKENIEETEPVIRNADLLSFDISSVRQSDAPGNRNASPNGFFGDEACQIVRYAGMSDKLSSIGFYETNPVFDNNDQTSMLVAQMIWYFLDGFSNRKNDWPYLDKHNYIKYFVSIENHKEDITFYKSKKSDRWWMEVPLETDQKTKYERHHLIPCSYKDYETACKHDIPDRWWQAYQKIMN